MKIARLILSKTTQGKWQMVIKSRTRTEHTATRVDTEKALKDLRLIMTEWEWEQMR
jgi:hypothetical protein